MLMMLCGDAWCDNDLVCRIFGFVFGEKIGVDDTGRLDFQFNGSSEIERKVEAVLEEAAPLSTSARLQRDQVRD